METHGFSLSTCIDNAAEALHREIVDLECGTQGGGWAQGSNGYPLSGDTRGIVSTFDEPINRVTIRTITFPEFDFVKKYLDAAAVSIDPFARNKQWATYTNDINPDTAAEYHLECEAFLQLLIDKGVEADLVILDPPYSPRQVKECYDSIGIKMAQEDAWGGAVRKRRRALINRLVRHGGVVLTFGWDTNGMGGSEWAIEEIMLVAHGSDHNDTICMAERRIAEQGHLAF